MAGQGSGKGKAALAGGVAAAVLTASAGGVAELQEREATVLSAYLDSVKIPTICTGHTGRVVIDGVDYGPVRLGMTLSRDQCRVLLKQDIEVTRKGLNLCVKRQLNQNQSDALISLAFNIGTGAACSGSVVRNINAGDFDAAAKAFLAYRGAWVTKDVVEAGKHKKVRVFVVIKGLVNRRQAETKTFTSSGEWIQLDTEANLKSMIKTERKK